MADSKKSTSRKFPVIALAGVAVAIAAGAGGAWLLMPRGALATGGATVATATAAPPAKPVFLKLDRSP
ncbi:MAG: hypothetical protein ACREPJ_03785 [Rhodanobacteraceae bacterium]